MRKQWQPDPKSGTVVLYRKGGHFYSPIGMPGYFAPALLHNWYAIGLQLTPVLLHLRDCQQESKKCQQMKHCAEFKLPSEYSGRRSIVPSQRRQFLCHNFFIAHHMNFSCLDRCCSYFKILGNGQQSFWFLPFSCIFQRTLQHTSQYTPARMRAHSHTLSLTHAHFRKCRCTNIGRRMTKAAIFTQH